MKIHVILLSAQLSLNVLLEIMAEKKYTFEVDVKANKTEVKDAVEEIFGVKVEKVNIMNYKGKFKRVGRYAGYTNKRRKAIVKLNC